MRYFVINAKNYSEVSGKGLERLAAAVRIVSGKQIFREVEFFLAPPNFGLTSTVNPESGYHVLAQHLDLAKLGASTGFSVPEIAKSFGAAGSLINHSEHRISRNDIEALISRLRLLGMISVVCAKDDEEVGEFSKLAPDFIAVEPPDLIGSGKAVSKVRPEVIMGSRSALDRNRVPNSTTKLLCGAGIVDGIDARLSVEMGAAGILVASGVIKAPDWENKIGELAQGLIDAKTPGAG